MAKAQTKRAVKNVEDVPTMMADIGQVDTFVLALERRYGFGRLLMACPDLELAERMRRQEDKFRQAIIDNDEQAIRAHGQGTIKGYQALERAYLAAGFKEIDQSAVIETLMPDGTVLQIVADVAKHRPVDGDTREIIGIGADVVATLFDEKMKKTLADVSKHWPGARVEQIRRKPIVADEIPF